MSDTLSPDQRHRNMVAIRSVSTKPELKLRYALWRLGFRYKVNDRSLPGSPDIVLPKYRSVIFVHGCFWHGHQGCKNYTVPKTNTDFWVAKVARNQERDQEVWRQLEAKGWFVIIVWECELKKKQLTSTINRIVQDLVANGEIYQKHKEERAINRQQHYLERKEQRIQHDLLIAELDGKSL